MFEQLKEMICEFVEIEEEKQPEHLLRYAKT